MLKIKIPSQELFNEATQEFINSDPISLTLEHSLVSLSKWESKYHKPFLSKDGMTKQETQDYIRFMTITQNVDPNVYAMMPQDIIDQINDYIEDSMTATTFRELPNSRKGREIITAEIIYHWMIVFQIPFECQRWHLNRLLTLIRVCNIKQDKPKKMTKRDILARNKALNAERRASLGTKG